MRIYIDIETQPTSDPAVIADLTAKVQAPSNYTKAETIESWWATKGESAVQEAIGKTALDPTYGSIISIAISQDDGEPTVLIADPENYSERQLLTEFSERIDSALDALGIETRLNPHTIYRPSPFWVGHNVSFDLGFIWRRMVINGVSPHFWIPSPAQFRHGKGCFCTMTAWAGHKERISLDRLCKTLGVPSPKATGMNGALAHVKWREGELEMVTEYNRADVIATREIFARLETMRVSDDQ